MIFLFYSNFIFCPSASKTQFLLSFAWITSLLHVCFPTARALTGPSPSAPSSNRVKIFRPPSQRVWPLPRLQSATFIRWLTDQGAEARPVTAGDAKTSELVADWTGFSQKERALPFRRCNHECKVTRNANGNRQLIKIDKEYMVESSVWVSQTWRPSDWVRWHLSIDKSTAGVDIDLRLSFDLLV